MPASTAAHAPMLALWELSILRNNNLNAKNSGCPHQAAFYFLLKRVFDEQCRSWWDFGVRANGDCLAGHYVGAGGRELRRDFSIIAPRNLAVFGGVVDEYEHSLGFVVAEIGVSVVLRQKFQSLASVDYGLAFAPVEQPGGIVMERCGIRENRVPCALRCVESRGIGGEGHMICLCRSTTLCREQIANIISSP